MGKTIGSSGRTIKRIFKKHQIPFSEIHIEQKSNEILYEISLTESVDVNQILEAVSAVKKITNPEMKTLLPIPDKSAIGLCFPN